MGAARAATCVRQIRGGVSERAIGPHVQFCRNMVMKGALPIARRVTRQSLGRRVGAARVLHGPRAGARESLQGDVQAKRWWWWWCCWRHQARLVPRRDHGDSVRGAGRRSCWWVADGAIGGADGLAEVWASGCAGWGARPETPTADLPGRPMPSEIPVYEGRRRVGWSAEAADTGVRVLGAVVGAGDRFGGLCV
eukprot:ctg_194.g135